MFLPIAQPPDLSGAAVFALRLMLATTAAWLLAAGLAMVLRRSRYARWLVDMAASLAGRSRPTERVGVAMAHPHDFQKRLSAILDPRRRRAFLSRRTTVLIALATGAMLIPLAVLNPFASRHATAAAPPPATQRVPPATQPAAPAARATLRSRIIGNVVDDQTGKPIEKFSVQVLLTQKGLPRTIDGSGSNGTYEVSALDGADSFHIRVTSDGYLTVDSGSFRNRGGTLQFDARLTKGGGNMGSVLTPDGKPAAGADVVLVERSAARIIDGILGGTANVSTITDAAGHFVLPPRTGQIRLMLFHDSGWNLIKTQANASLQNLPPRAWCKVEGVLMKGDKPWPRQMIDLKPTTKFGDSLIERQNFLYQVITDSKGKFTIEHVVDGTSEVGVELAVPNEEGRQMTEVTHAVPLDLKPGESKAGVQIGGTGRPIVGRVNVSDELKAKGLVPVDAWLYLAPPPRPVRPPNWDSMSEQDRQRLYHQYVQTDAYQRYEKRVKDFRAGVNADGSIRIEDVPAGDYTLYIAVYRRSSENESFSQPRAKAELKVTVPEMQGGRSDAALDVGPVDLKAVPHPEVGEIVPEFEAADFNKGRIKLSDYRGRFVLLNFWSAWSAPSIEEFKNLEKLNQAYAADPRFVMIGVSLDERADEPAKYLTGRKLPWPQAYGGALTWKTFGIGLVPSVWMADRAGRENHRKGDPGLVRGSSRKTGAANEVISAELQWIPSAASVDYWLKVGPFA